MNVPAAESVYTTQYTDFKGVDFTSQLCSTQRFPIGKNFVISDMVEKRPGYKCLKKFDEKINGFYYVSDENYYLIHAGDKLYSLISFSDEPTLLLEGINNDKSSGFYANGFYYILTGKEYIQASKSEALMINEENYNNPFEVIDTTSTNARNKVYQQYSGLMESEELYSCKKTTFVSIPVEYESNASFESFYSASASSMIYEDLMTRFKKNNIISNLLSGIGCVQYSSFANCDFSEVWNDGNPYYDYTKGWYGYLLPEDAAKSSNVYIEYEDGQIEGTRMIQCNYAISKQDGSQIRIDILVIPVSTVNSTKTGQSFKVYYQKKTIDPKIYTCKHSTYLQYGNGVYHFFTGNDSFPNRDWQSVLNDPTCIPSDNYTIYGKEDQVLGYGQYGENIAVFKKGNVDNNIYIRSAMETDDLGVVFPVSVGVGGAIGGISSYTIKNLNGETLFLTKEGIYALTSLSLTNMKVTRNRSYYVDGKLLKEPDLENAIACVWKNKYILCINGNCYILDAGQPLSYREGSNNDYSYECLFWDNIPATAFLSVDNVLYFGTDDGRICKMTEGLYEDDGDAIDTVIATKLDDDGNFMAYKKMKKKGTGLLVKPYTKSSFDISFIYDDYEDAYVKTAYADIFNFNDIDFDRFTFKTSSNPRIIPFLKKSKKYKSIQILIKSCNKEPFGFMSIIKRFTFNNYVKRS